MSATTSPGSASTGWWTSSSRSGSAVTGYASSGSAPVCARKRGCAWRNWRSPTSSSCPSSIATCSGRSTNAVICCCSRRTARATGCLCSRPSLPASRSSRATFPRSANPPAAWRRWCRRIRCTTGSARSSRCWDPAIRPARSPPAGALTPRRARGTTMCGECWRCIRNCWGRDEVNSQLPTSNSQARVVRCNGIKYLRPSPLLRLAPGRFETLGLGVGSWRLGVDVAMRVTHLGKFYPPVPGGMERVLQSLCEGERERGIDSRALVVATARATIRESVNGVPVTRAASWLRVGSVRFAPPLIALLRCVETDILVLHEPNPMALLAFALTRPKHRLAVWYHSEVLRPRWRYKLIYEPFLRVPFLRASRIVVSSPALPEHAEALRAHASRCEVIPFGLDVQPAPA